MITDSRALEGQFARHRAVTTALAEGDADRALALYLEPESAPIRKPNLEWALAAAVLERGLAGHDRAAWPPDRLLHPAGASLRVAAGQVLVER